MNLVYTSTVLLDQLVARVPFRLWLFLLIPMEKFGCVHHHLRSNRLSQQRAPKSGGFPALAGAGRSRSLTLVGRAGDLRSRPGRWRRHPRHCAAIARNAGRALFARDRMVSAREAVHVLRRPDFADWAIVRFHCARALAQGCVGARQRSVLGRPPLGHASRLGIRTDSLHRRSGRDLQGTVVVPGCARRGQSRDAARGSIERKAQRSLQGEGALQGRPGVRGGALCLSGAGKVKPKGGGILDVMRERCAQFPVPDHMIAIAIARTSVIDIHGGRE